VKPLIHSQVQASGIATLSEDEISIDFSNMPVRHLVALRRLDIGMSAKYCDSWNVASSSAAKALTDYLDHEFEPDVSVTNDFTLRVQLTGDIESIYPYIVRFFARESVTIERYTGERSRAVV
jgi:hypothetical protein